MQLYKNNRQRYMAGLVYIFLIYSMHYLIFTEHFLIGKYKVSPIMNRIILFVFAVLIYLVGSVHLRKLQGTWMLYLWHFIYISLLAILLVIIIVKLICIAISYEIRPIDIFPYIQVILISPMLYLMLGLLNRLLVKAQQF